MNPRKFFEVITNLGDDIRVNAKNGPDAGVFPTAVA
jgi:hypothetical protein